MKYSDWKTNEWDTPVSRLKSLRMEKLVDHCDDGLTITLQAERSDGRPRFQVRFGRSAAYRNILEEYRIGLWEHLSDEHPNWPTTLIVDPSPWKAEFTSNDECLLDVHHENAIHYVLITEDDVIEILSNDSPDWKELPPASSDSVPPGKSEIVYWSDKQ